MKLFAIPHWLLAIVILASLTNIAAAQSDSSDADRSLAPFEPPRTETSEAFFTAVEGRGLQTRIDYLHPDSELDAELAPIEREDTGPRDLSDPVRLLSIAILIGLLLLIGIYVWHRRGALSDLAGPKTGRKSKAAKATEPLADDDRDIDRDFIARLRSEADPRAGLRQVLQRFLKLAAADNEIVLKRSLTTRELLQLLPGSWRHRNALQTVANRVELAVFGGREISRADYEECLDLAAPFLKRTKR